MTTGTAGEHSCLPINKELGLICHLHCTSEPVRGRKKEQQGFISTHSFAGCAGQGALWEVEIKPFPDESPMLSFHTQEYRDPHCQNRSVLAARHRPGVCISIRSTNLLLILLALLQTRRAGSQLFFDLWPHIHWHSPGVPRIFPLGRHRRNWFYVLAANTQDI